MGVPGFFGWLLKKYDKNIIYKKLHIKPKYLFIDANGLFHPKCFEVLADITNINKPLHELEWIMIKKIVAHIKFLIRFINPTEYTYIGVDGVAPVAKINHQRIRRYKSYHDEQEIKKIKDKYGVAYSKWSNIVITPGTKFMEKLHEELLKLKGDTVKYSSYLIPSEGEHKFFIHMKKKNIINENIVIHGLDADLIFLSMLSNNHIYLLRDEIKFKIKTLEFLSIDVAKDKYNIELNSNLGLHEDYIQDLVFICILIGNDFISSLASINIRIGGMDMIMNAYVNAYKEYNINIINIDTNNKININEDVFIEFIKNLSEVEEEFFRETLSQYKIKKKKNIEIEPYKREIFDLQHLNNIKIHDPVKLGIGKEEDYKYRYYKYNFEIKEDMINFVNNLCKKYLTGLVWVLYYYFDKCYDWRWFFPYSHGPFASDLYKFLINNKDFIKNIIIQNNNPVSMDVQMVTVIPPQYNYILPLHLRKCMNNKKINYMYPINIEQECEPYTTELWQCHAKLPMLNIDKIEQVVNNLLYIYL